MKKSIVALVSLAVLAGAPLGSTPATAAPKGTVWLVHGIPRVPAEVCVGTNEVRSSFVFGEKFRLRLDPGTYRVRVRARHLRRCRGAILASKTVVVVDGDSHSMVFWTQAGVRQITTFTNDVTPTGAGNIRLVARHTARFGLADVRWNNPVLFQNVAQGGTAETLVAATEGDAQTLWFARDGQVTPVVGPRVFVADDGYSFHFYAVGTKTSNFALIVIKELVGI